LVRRFGANRVPRNSVSRTGICERDKILHPAVLIGSDVNDDIGIELIILNQRSDELIQPHDLPVQGVFALRIDLHRPHVALINFLVGLPRCFWQVQRQTFFEERRGDDEDDEQHEREVEQRSDINFTQRDQRTAL